MDERARAIFDEARETLHRIRGVTVERRDHDAEYWQRPEPKPAARNVVIDHVLTDAEAQRWQTYIADQIERANSARDDYWRDVLGSLISEVRKQLRSEISAEVGLLRADVEIQTKAAERRDHDRGEVVDMVQPLERRRHA
jgi:hypothetical protein